MKGMLEIKSKENRLKSEYIYIKNADTVAEMDIKRGDKFKLRGKEYEVTLFIITDKSVYIDVEII